MDWYKFWEIFGYSAFGLLAVATLILWLYNRYRDQLPNFKNRKK